MPYCAESAVKLQSINPQRDKGHTDVFCASVGSTIKLDDAVAIITNLHW